MEKENGKEEIPFRFILVPNFIIEDTNLSDGAKLLFGEISSNSLKKGYCWFSNQYLMERFGISDRTASRWISELRMQGYITVEIKRRDASKEIGERRIKIDTTKPIVARFMQWFGQKWREVPAKNGSPPLAKNGGVNNTHVNNTCLINLSPLDKTISNVSLNETEYQRLIKDFGELSVQLTIRKYANWKTKCNAHPKSDFDSLQKWLDKSKHKSKAKVSSVKESGTDEVTDAMLEDLPF